MPKIRVLPKEVSELIAAGEVIDRPASVVKELVENAIDSGASEVTVEIKRGGIEYIRVADNGCGIRPEDVPVAFLRHATSKVRTEEDLNVISTLGFRGEALASVCAVARVEMLTKTERAPYGTRFRIEGGEQTALEEVGCPDGTTVIVRDLFYNVPARLKFLKKDVSEGNAVASLVNRIALSNPAVSLRFLRDNELQLQTPGDGELYSAIHAVYGKGFAGSLTKVDYTLGDVSVSGFSSLPSGARANRSMQHFFVNGRYVRSRTCTTALEEGYKNAIMVGKFPACVLNVSLPFDQVDVNVHPTKTEVRFVNERSVFDCLFFAVKTAIAASEENRTASISGRPLRREFAPENPGVQELFPIPPDFTVREFEARKNASPRPSAPASPSGELTVASGGKEYKVNLEPREEEFLFLTPERLKEASGQPSREEPRAEKPAGEEPAGAEPRIRVIGEVYETFILAEIDGTFVMVDKHAAHERILYEKLRSERKPLDHQVLLSPFTVALSVEECEALLTHAQTVSDLGFLVESFGTTMVLVREIPVILDQHDASRLLEEIALNLCSHKQDPSPSKLDELYHSVACKAAIKAHDKNTEPELYELVRRVFTDEAVRYCPHGRPVLQIFSKSKLDRMFGRQ